MGNVSEEGVCCKLSTGSGELKIHFFSFFCFLCEYTGTGTLSIVEANIEKANLPMGSLSDVCSYIHRKFRENNPHVSP